MNYGELKQAIVDESHRADLISFVPDFIRRAEGRIARDLISTEQEVTTTIGESDREDGGIYNLPAGTLLINSIRLGDRAMRQVSLAELKRIPSSAPPFYYAVSGNRIEFRGVPAEDAEFDISYVQRFTALTADEDENALLTNHEDLYVYGALFYMYAHTQDIELADGAIRIFNEAVDALNDQAGRKLSGAETAGAYNLYGGGGGY